MLSWLKEASSPAAPLILSVKIDDKRMFTTLECFTGTLKVKAVIDTHFEKLDIRLIGTSRTYGRRVVPQAPNARTVTTAHRFLELNQPNLHFHFPEHKAFKAGCTYEFPFRFALPDRMLPATCRHVVSSPCVHDLHTLMPPSFGDSEFGDIVDYAPRHTSIKYRVVARIREVAESGELRDIGNCSERLRFVPLDLLRVPHVSDWDPARYIHEELSLRKLWNKPSGKLVVTFTRLSPFEVEEVHSSIWCGKLHGRAQMSLEYHPTYDGGKPPAEVDIDATLRAETISAVVPLPQLPSDDPSPGPEIDRHTAPAIMLSCQALGDIEWALQSNGVARNSDERPAYEKSPSSPQASSNICSKPYYTTRIEASLSATIGFSIVPTFHSCLISRMYHVDIRLGARGSVLEFATALRLKLPVEVIRKEAVIRRDSAVINESQTEDIVERCGRTAEAEDLMWEDLGPTNHLDIPPGYESSS